MASVPPPDGPTEQLRPAAAAIVHEPAAVPVVETGSVVRLEQVVAGLRTWLAVVGVVAIAAIGVAIYAMIVANDNSPSGRGGFATNARVDRISTDLKALRAGGAPSSSAATGGAAAAAGSNPGLSARVDQLASQVRTLSAGGSTSSGSAALSARVAAVESSVRSLAGRPATSSSSTQQLAQLSTRVDSLASDVAQLKQSPPPPAP